MSPKLQNKFLAVFPMILICLLLCTIHNKSIILQFIETVPLKGQCHENFLKLRMWGDRLGPTDVPEPLFKFL